ncbi:MerR family transcriptional regulator [Paenibacillus beijingensis]|uniref:HTH merR-type domain-containing protein n=1 Tax=Paenibacillus beijingensis TaxID=1126833 RepID=A0A0D5NK64_9BACL|nr:MerR family transcriptional regulator [Paenibacillus beijingensis]AJY75402.1 hypothetical protein VN24_13530 [Paenibacillus beijingensis]
MLHDQLYTIGHTARICGISIQTLRYYDKIGLVHPSHTDNQSNYRYYSNRDILQIKVVQDMKRLHFSLDQIGQIISSGGLEGLMAVMRDKHNETKDEIERLRQTAVSIEKRMDQIESLLRVNEKFGTADFLIDLKSLPARTVAFDRRRSECGMEASIVRFTGLFGTIESHGLASQGFMMTIYHENILTFDRSDSDLELCIPVSGGAPASLPFIRVIPGGTYITAVYSGTPNEESCKKIYRELTDWARTHGYCESGPAIEQYLVDLSQMLDPDEYIVELQLPVTKC